MGRVTVFCLLSGCTPEIPNSLVNLFSYADIDEEPGPIVLEALRTLVDDVEKQGQEDMTVIRASGENGGLDGISKQEALRIPDSSLRVIQHCEMGNLWRFGFIDHPHHSPDKFLVSHGTNIMVQTASLHILAFATSERMTPERVWRLAMHQGYSAPHDGHGLDGINYGEIHHARGQDPLLVPNLSLDEIIKLESLGDVEVVKKAIINDGKFWVWMRPDRFPLNSTPSDDLAVPTILEPPSTSTPLSKIEQLPVEMLFQISSLLPLPSLLHFLAASRRLRCILLGSESGRDTLARTWIQTTGVWYLPVPYEKLSSDGRKLVIDWAYLRRCLRSGSMRNRRRIWQVVEQIEEMADGFGI